MDIDARTFHGALEQGIVWGNGNHVPFALIVLSTAEGLSDVERRKLLCWGEMALRNTTPVRARVFADKQASRCLILIPGLDETNASEVASYLEIQLNKLPVAGVAPGRGWTSSFTLYPSRFEALDSIRARQP
jgi:hypothetical protein